MVPLDPAGLQIAATEQDLSPAQTEPVPDALEQLPQGYDAGGVPQLGPPLPGDLGRPILAHQRGHIPTIKVGSMTLISVAALERFLGLD